MTAAALFAPGSPGSQTIELRCYGRVSVVDNATRLEGRNSMPSDAVRTRLGTAAGVDGQMDQVIDVEL